MGPLAGLTIIEMAGIGPGPFAGMMLADMGADVVRVERPQPTAGSLATDPVLLRGRRVLRLDLKQPDAVESLLALCETADALIEGFRPGVMERLGLGPAQCCARNSRLVYGRMTGWGQTGPLAPRAGHDINYIALSGALAAIGRAGDKPLPPLNLIADFGGGGMLLAFGVVCALFEARQSGRGQVVDAAMVDGSSSLMAMFHGLRAQGAHTGARGTNLLDSGAPFYETYETADHQYMAVGALEPAFYAELLQRLGLDPGRQPAQYDVASWPAMKQKFTEIFRTKTRADWSEHFADSDACVTPVLSIAEAAEHPHNAQRQSFIQHAGTLQPAPAPRFSRTVPKLQR